MRVLRHPELWTIVAASAVLTLGHYSASQQDPFWHDLFRRLYYLPIILAGFRYGLRGGLVTAAAISLVFLPHVLMTRQMLHVQASEVRFEIPLYLLVGIVTGVLADRQRRANELLRRAERLKTLGEMAAGMAHEVKNPLAAIRSSAQILRGRVGEKQEELVDIVVAEVDRLNKVVNDFLQYARPAPLRRSEQRLSGILDSCLELLGPLAAEKRLTVEKSYPDSEPRVSVDEDQMRQVFLNLILNGMQAAPADGRIRLRVERTPRSVSASVEDNGAGIPADKLRRVFEPFFTTREGGSGLGLAVAHRIVSEHGGRLEIRSESGAGTTATVILDQS